jgi:hypothetical protein
MTGPFKRTELASMKALPISSFWNFTESGERSTFGCRLALTWFG